MRSKPILLQATCALALSALLIAVEARAAADVRLTGCTLLDDCYCHETDGFVDPGEFIYVIVNFENRGDTDARDFSGFIALEEGGDEKGGFGAFGPADVAAGGRYSFGVFVLAKAACTELVDIDVTDLRSADGPHPDGLTECDYIVGDGKPDCIPCCEVIDIEAIQPVLAVKDGADVHLTWEPDPLPSASGYNTYVVSDAANKAEIPNARAGGSWPLVAGCDNTPRAPCVDPAATDPERSRVLYYQVRGLCATLEADE